MIRSICTLLCCFVLATICHADERSADGRLTVIRAGRVITVSGETYTPGMVILEGSKIRLVGKNLEYPASARVIDAGGETVMPGLVLPRTRFQLDSYRRAGVHGAKSAADEIVPSEIEWEKLASAGFTTVAFVPAGTGIPGFASAFRPTRSDEERLRQENSYLRITMRNPVQDRNVLKGALEKAKKEIEKVKKAREEWEKKQKASEAKKEAEKKEPPKPTPPQPRPRPGEFEEDGPAAEPQPTPEKKPEAPKEPEKFTPPKIDPNVQPLVDRLEGKDVAIVFDVGGASDLRHLDATLELYPEVTGSYALSLGFYDDPRPLVELLGKRKALVMLTPSIDTLPYTVNLFNLPAQAARAGCRLVFVPGSDSERSFERLLAQVADVVRAGLDRDAALRAMTIHGAELLGLASRIGSLEKGKDADIVFVDGDPLSPGSSVTRVMIDGELVWRKKR